MQDKDVQPKTQTNNNQGQSQNHEQAHSQNQRFSNNTLVGGIQHIKNRLHMGNSRGQQQNVAKNVYDAITTVASAVPISVGEISMLFLDNTVSPVAVSAVVFALKVKNQVITSTLLIEGSEVSRINPIKVEFAGTTTELARPITDLYDVNTTAAVEELVRTAFDGENITVIDVGASIVPSEVSGGMKVEDLIKSVAIQKISFYAINNIIAANIDITDDASLIFNAGWAVSDKQSRVRANIDKNPAPETTAAELPVRADVTITIGAATNDNSNTAKFNTASDLTVVAGYMDLTYVDPRDAAAIQSQISGVQVDPSSITQRYNPRFVITKVDSCLALVTPEMSLLAIGSALALSRDNSWIGLFAPKYGRVKGTDLSDVGALGFEAVHLTQDGTAARIDVKSDSFASDPSNLVDFITTVMFSSVSYSQDILECSDLGSIDSMYLAAADKRNAPGDQGAINAIIKHADNLTMGRFSQLWEGGSIARYDDVLVPIGYYEDKNGVLQDLRNYDYLAMLNTYGDTDMSLVEKFANTLDKTDTPVYYRMSVAKEILTHMLGGSVTIKGFAHRIDWNPKFLGTLVSAISATGLVVESNSIGAFSANPNRRGNVNIIQNAVKYNGVNGFLTYGNQGGYSGQYGAAQMHNRFVR